MLSGLARTAMVGGRTSATPVLRQQFQNQIRTVGKVPPQKELTSTILTWRRISIIGIGPIVALIGYLFVVKDHHHAHREVFYDFEQIRTSRFPWGDGDTSLFGNSPKRAAAERAESGDHH